MAHDRPHREILTEKSFSGGSPSFIRLLILARYSLYFC